MKKNIQKYVEECEICQRNKYETLSPTGLLQPLPIPTSTWTDLSMEHVVIDRLTKFGHFFALSHPYSAKEEEEIFVKEVVKLHGFPQTIISDQIDYL